MENSISSSDPVADEHLAKPIAGIALACIISVVAVVVLASSTDNFLRAFLLWTVYVSLCGLAIEAPSTTSVRRMIGYALPPTIAFFVASTALFVLGAMALQGICVSCGSSPLTLADYVTVIPISAGVSILTLPGIIAGIYARTRIFDAWIALQGVTVAELKATRRKVQIIGSIILILLGILLFELPGRNGNAG